MSISSITAAQRAALRDASVKAARAAQRFAQDGAAPSIAEQTNLTTLFAQSALAIAVAGIASQQLKAVTMWNLIHTETAVSAQNYVRVYMPTKVVTGSGDVKGIVLRYPARIRRFNLANTEALGNAMTVSKASLQTASTSAPVFKGGSRSFVIADGVNTDSDVITPQALGFANGLIPVGTVMWHKMLFTIPVGGKVPRNLRNLYGQANVPGWFLAADTVITDVDTLGTAAVVSGPAAEGIESPYCPYILGYFNDPATKAFCLDGDSIGAGQGDDNSFGNTGMGGAQRALGLFDVPMASINLSCPGATAGNGQSDTYLDALMALGPDGYWLNAMTNNGNDPLAFTAAQAEAELYAKVQKYKNAPGVKVGAKAAVTKLLPRTYDPAGGYVTDAAQQIYNQWDAGQFSAQANALLVTPRYDAVIQRSVFRSSTNQFKFTGPTKLTIDGTHLNATGYALDGAQMLPVLKALWM